MWPGMGFEERTSRPSVAADVASRNALRCSRERRATSSRGTTLGSPSVAAKAEGVMCVGPWRAGDVRLKPAHEPPFSRWLHQAQSTNFRPHWQAASGDPTAHIRVQATNAGIRHQHMMSKKPETAALPSIRPQRSLTRAIPGNQSPLRLTNFRPHWQAASGDPTAHIRCPGDKRWHQTPAYDVKEA